MVAINITTLQSCIPYDYGKETAKGNIINVKDIVCHWPFRIMMIIIRGQNVMMPFKRM